MRTPDFSVTHSDYQRGLSLSRIGDTSGARKAFEVALADNPLHIPSLFALGCLLRQDSKPDLAMQHFLTVLEHAPEHIESHIHLAWLLLTQNRIRNAEGAFKHVLTLEDQRPEAHFGLALCKEKLGQLSSALEHFSVSLEAGYESHASRKGIARLRLYQGKPKAAIDTLLETAVDETDASSIELLARCYTANNQAPQALINYQKLINKHGATPERLYNCASLLSSMKRYREAIPFYQSASEQKENLYQAWIGLAASSASCGDTETARSASIRAIHHRPPSKQPSSNGHAKVALVLRHLGSGYFQFDHASRPILQRENNLEEYLNKDEWELIEVYLERLDQDPEFITRIKHFDLIVNGVADPDRGLSALNKVRSICTQLQAPIINPTSAIKRTTRDVIAQVSKDIDGLYVPKTVAFTFSTKTSLPPLPPFPLIIRKRGMHRGASAVLIHQPSDLTPHLQAHGEGDFYAIEYIHNPFRPGLWRRLRILKLGDQFIPITCHFAKDWNVHSTDRGSFMHEDPSLMEMESQFIDHMESLVGQDGMQAIEVALQKTELDYVGIDFDLMPDGKILVFEINAAMAPQESLGAEYPHLAPVFDQMRQSMNELAQRKCSLP